MVLFNKKIASPITEWDNLGNGLGVRYNRNGTSVYILKYHCKRRQILKTVCPTSLLSIDEARLLACRVKLIAKAGEDPIEIIHRLMDTKTADVVNVRRFCEIYMIRHSKEHKKSWRKDQQLINRFILPRWGDRPLSSINRTDVSKCHYEIGKTSQFTANRVKDLFHSMCKLGIIWGYLPANHPNPSWGIRSYTEKSRDRFLRESEKPAFLAAVDRHPDIYVRTAIRLDLLIGLRCSELLSLRWDYIDFQEKLLSLPDTKSGRPHLMPLPQAAVDLLIVLPSRKFSSFVFPSVGRNTHRSRIDKAFYKIRAEAGLHDLRFHDLRRTVGCSILKLTGSLTMVGTVLNQTTEHVKKVYAHYELDSVREALEDNAARISGCAEKI